GRTLLNSGHHWSGSVAVTCARCAPRRHRSDSPKAVSSALGETALAKPPDGLSAHRSTHMRAWLNTQRHWLVTQQLPAYAPDLNPVEALWSCLKAVELANLT